MSILKVGQQAPAFSLSDSQHSIHALSDYQQQWLVLFFYPKDNTPGCTVEACHFRDDYADISATGTKILGISTDSVESHSNYISKQSLPFPLLSDSSGSMSRLYDSLFKLGPIKFCKRHSFIINPEGKVAKTYYKVKPSSHSQEVLADLKVLQANF